MTNKLKFIRRVSDIIMGSGEKRKKFAIEHVFYVLFALLFGYLTALLLSGDLGDIHADEIGTLLLSWLGALVCIFCTVYFFITGILAQAILFVCALICMFFADRRRENLAAFLISLITLLAVVVGVIVLLSIL